MTTSDFWSAVHAPLLVLLLLMVINSAPILLKYLLGRRYAWPLDGGWNFFDNRRLLGESKTLRGVLVAMLAGALFAPLAGLSIVVGFGLAAASMAGDILTSFVKRRLGLAPSSHAVVLDQVPEAVLPLLVFRQMLALDWPAIIGVALAFLLVDVTLSRLLYRIGLRDEPY